MRHPVGFFGMLASLTLFLISDALAAAALPATMVGQDGAKMVLVAAGAFPMGSEGTEIERVQDRMRRFPSSVLVRFTDQMPKHQVNLEAFYIDRYEVTNALYAKFMQASGRLAPRLWEERRFNGPQQPVVGVTWHEAQAYCAWAGKRLPSEAEWEKAARGTEGHVYPWGNAFDGTRLNFCDVQCPHEWRDAAVDDGHATTAPVGSYTQGKSPYGAYDMAGNVWEWVADWYATDYYQHSPEHNPPGPASGERKTVRGGAWFVPESAARTATRQHFDAYYWGDNIGLRCALTPE